MLCVCIHRCMCVCIHMCLCVCAYICACVCAHIYVHVVCVCIHMCMWCMFVYVCAYICACGVCVCACELEDNLESCSSDNVHFGLWTQGLSLAWNLSGIKPPVATSPSLVLGFQVCKPHPAVFFLHRFWGWNGSCCSCFTGWIVASALDTQPVVLPHTLPARLSAHLQLDLSCLLLVEPLF